MRPPALPNARLLWAFDFDGVLCHSAKELCLTGWAAAQEFWPSETQTWPKRPGPATLSSFYRVRPVVETGWEVMLINRALQEGEYSADTILKEYTASLRESLMKEYGGHAPEAYMDTFRSVRQAWMTRDERGWLSENDFYPTAVSSIKHLLSSHPPSSPSTYIVTTKGKEFTLKLLEGMGVAMPESCVFGLGSGKKVDVLQQLLDKYDAESKAREGKEKKEAKEGDMETRVIFIEDRLQTLLGILDHPSPDVRDRADLLLAGWGYNTAEERAVAASHPSITYLETEQALLDYVKERHRNL
ncbi:haloacid dehalogenase [Nannochloropsis oceanica]